MPRTKKSIRPSTQDGRPKRKKFRKPLTEEQKAERVERLAKARAAKAPSEHKSVHYSVSRDESDPVNVKSVRAWIKSNQERLSSAKQSKKLNPKDKNIANEVNILETYIHNLQSYLRTGIWLDFRWGENMEGKIQRINKVKAYHWHPRDPFLGMVRRDVGVWYDDIGLWTKEMDEEYYGVRKIEEKPKKRKVRTKRKPK